MPQLALQHTWPEAQVFAPHFTVSPASGRVALPVPGGETLLLPRRPRRRDRRLSRELPTRVGPPWNACGGVWTGAAASGGAGVAAVFEAGRAAVGDAAAAAGETAAAGVEATVGAAAGAATVEVAAAAEGVPATPPPFTPGAEPASREAGPVAHAASAKTLAVVNNNFTERLLTV